jgi:hypothetical protein
MKGVPTTGSTAGVYRTVLDLHVGGANDRIYLNRLGQEIPPF